jgi:hypothetical protein
VGVCFSPDGKRLVTTGMPANVAATGSIKLWDLKTGEQVLTLGPGAEDLRLLRIQVGFSAERGGIVAPNFEAARPWEAPQRQK